MPDLPALTARLLGQESDGVLKPGLDASQVTPGTLGFLLTLFIVLASIFLIRDMVKRIRRVRYRAEVQEAQMRDRESGPGETEAPSGR